MAPVLVGSRIEIQEGQKDGVPDHDHYYEHVDYIGPVEYPDDVWPSLECYVRKDVKYDAWNQEKHMMPQLPFYKECMPFRAYEPFAVLRCPSENALDKYVEAYGDEYHRCDH